MLTESKLSHNQNFNKHMKNLRFDQIVDANNVGVVSGNILDKEFNFKRHSAFAEWLDYLVDAWQNIFTYTSDHISESNLNIINENLLYYGRVCVIRPTRLYKTFEYSEDTLIVRPFTISLHNTATHEPIKITAEQIFQPVHSFPQKIVYDRKRGDNFEIINTHINLNQRNIPPIFKLIGYAKKLATVDASFYANADRLNQPVVMSTSYEGDNISEIYSHSIASLASVVNIKEEFLPEGGKLFHDIDRTNETMTLFEAQQAILDDFYRLIGRSQVETHGTYQARDVQLENQDSSKLKETTLIRNISRGINRVNKTFGANLQLTINR